MGERPQENGSFQRTINNKKTRILNQCWELRLRKERGETSPATTLPGDRGKNPHENTEPATVDGWGEGGRLGLSAKEEARGTGEKKAANKPERGDTCEKGEAPSDNVLTRSQLEREKSGKKIEAREECASGKKATKGKGRERRSHNKRGGLK